MAAAMESRMIRADFHLHSEYSFDSRTSLNELIERAVEVDLNCLALTDHNTIEGALALAEIAPFQVIVVTAAPSRVPAPLLDQLAVGGRLIAPVGPDSGPQRLELWRRVESGRGEGAFVHEELADVRFVPFLGEAARRR